MSRWEDYALPCPNPPMIEAKRAATEQITRDGFCLANYLVILMPRYR